MNETIDNVFYLMLVSHFLAIISGMCLLKIIQIYLENEEKDS
jgi:hypothetical protein